MGAHILCVFVCSVCVRESGSERERGRGRKTQTEGSRGGMKGGGRVREASVAAANANSAAAADDRRSPGGGGGIPNWTGRQRTCRRCWD